MSTLERADNSQTSPSREDGTAASLTLSETTVTDAGPRAWSRRHLPFLAMGSLWLSVVYAVSRGLGMDVFAVGLGMLLLAIPMSLAGICTSTLRRHRWLSALFRQKGRFYRLLSGWWLSIPLQTIWGLGISFLLLLQFRVYEPVEWAVIAVAPGSCGNGGWMRPSTTQILGTRVSRRQAQIREMQEFFRKRRHACDSRLVLRDSQVRAMPTCPDRPSHSLS